MSDGGNGMSTGYIALFWALSLAIAILMGFWAGRMGERNGRSFGSCFLLGFVLGIIGVLIVYLIGHPGTARPSGDEPADNRATSDASGRKHLMCSQCGNLIPSDEEFCQYCGSRSGAG